MHAAGVVHGDLKRKDNIIVGPGERPYLIDFGVAWLRSNSTLLNRVWFEPGKQMDYNAWIKLKYQRRTDSLSATDAALYRPLLIERYSALDPHPGQSSRCAAFANAGAAPAVNDD